MSIERLYTIEGNIKLLRVKSAVFKADRHLVAAWNIGLKSSIWVPYRPPKATHDLFKSEAERTAIKH